MLTIRMRRLGAKKRPFFRVVVTEARSGQSGRSLEVIGYYDPAKQPEVLQINRNRFQHWVDNGAQPSDTLRTLLARNPEGVESAKAVQEVESVQEHQPSTEAAISSTEIASEGERA